MNRKQKEQLRFYQNARKRADKVLAERREAQQKKLENAQRVEENRLLLERYTHDLTDLAQQSGILELVRAAALEMDGMFTSEVNCYVDYGISSSAFQRVLLETQRGTLKVAYLALRVRWPEGDLWNQVEVHVFPDGRITFHQFLLPVFPFFWRRNTRLLKFLMEDALRRPFHTAPPDDEQRV